MNSFDRVRAFTALSIDFLVDVAKAARSMPKAQLAEELGLAKAEVSKLLWTHSFYTTPRVKKHAKGIGLGSLREVASAINQLAAKDVDRDDVMVECLEAVKDLSVDAAKAAALAIVRRYNKGPVRRKSRVHTQRKPDACGQRRLIGVFSDEELTRVEKNLEPEVSRVMRTQGIEHSEAFAQVMVGRLSGEDNSGNAAYSPLLFLPLRPSEGYFEDGKVYTADGCGVPLEELDGTEISDTGFVIVSAKDHDGTQQAQALPIRRFANDAQRLVLRTETMVCPYPGCNMPAWKCQYHHIEAYSNGGATVIENLMLLCQPHNAANDDGPTDKNGRMLRDARGRPAFRRKPGAELQYNTDPAVQKGWRSEAELHAKAEGP